MKASKASEEMKPAVNPQTTGEPLPLTFFAEKTQMEKSNIGSMACTLPLLLG